MGLFDKFSHHDKQQATPVTPVTTSPSPQNEPVPGGSFINLKKTAGISLEKNNLSGVKAAVYLVLDYSGSMKSFYNNHTVQDFTEKVLAISANLDDDGTVPVILFDDHARPAEEVTVTNYHGAIDRLKEKAGHMGTTNYAAAMQAVIDLHKASGATQPALVIFQTDGSPDSRPAAERMICESASLPIFWQFVGFGSDEFTFLHKLDDLEVPKKRVIDNAGFYKVGSDPKHVPTSELYDTMLSEFPEWLKKAKAQGIVH